MHNNQVFDFIIEKGIMISKIIVKQTAHGILGRLNWACGQGNWFCLKFQINRIIEVKVLNAELTNKFHSPLVDFFSSWE